MTAWIAIVIADQAELDVSVIIENVQVLVESNVTTFFNHFTALNVQWVTTAQMCKCLFFAVKATADGCLVCATHNVPTT